MAPDAGRPVHVGDRRSPPRSPSRRRRSASGSGSRARSTRSRRAQEIRLWAGVERVELTTSLHDYRGQDRLFRVRFPAAVEGGAPVSEVGNAVIGRPFGRPNVDVAEVPFTLDHPAYNWFALGATARVALGRRRRVADRAARASARDRRRRGGRSPTIRARTPPFATSSSRSSGRASRRRCRGTMAIATACCTSTPTCPTSGWRSAGPDENSFVAAVLDDADAVPRRARAAAGRPGLGARCGYPRTATRTNDPSRSPTCAARATCRCSSSPAPIRTPRPARSMAVTADLDDGGHRGRPAGRARRRDRHGRGLHRRRS